MGDGRSGLGLGLGLGAVVLLLMLKEEDGNGEEEQGRRGAFVVTRCPHSNCNHVNKQGREESRLKHHRSTASAPGGAVATRLAIMGRLGSHLPRAHTSVQARATACDLPCSGEKRYLNCRCTP